VISHAALWVYSRVYGNAAWMALFSVKAALHKKNKPILVLLVGGKNVREENCALF